MTSTLPPPPQAPRTQAPVWQRVLVTLVLMSCAVFILNLAAPTTAPTEQYYHPQYASPTTNDTAGIPCLTYWQAGCPALKGPYLPVAVEQQAQSSSSSSTLTATTTTATTTTTTRPRIGLLRYLTTPLPDFYTASDTLRNLKTILQIAASSSSDSQPNAIGDIQQHWFLYRIADPAFLQNVTQLLHQYNQSYTTIPFELQKHYQRIQPPFSWHVFDAYKETHRDVYHVKWHLTGTGIFTPAKRAAVTAAALRDKRLYLWNQGQMINYMLDWAEVEWTAVDWLVPCQGDTTFWTPAVHQHVVTALQSQIDPAQNYVVLPRRQLTDRQGNTTRPSKLWQSNDATNSFAWQSEPVPYYYDASSLYDQTDTLVTHTPRDGYQVMWRAHKAVGRLHPLLHRYAMQEFLSRLRVDGYGWWNVTADATWLPAERKLLQHVRAPDVLDPQDVIAKPTAPSATAASNNDPWRLSLQAPPSDWNARGGGVPMINVTLPLLYTRAAERVQALDIMNATYYRHLFEAQSMIQAVVPLDYQMAKLNANISLSSRFVDTGILNKLLFYDRAMLKYEKNLYQQAQYQAMDANMPNRVQSLVWMIYKLAEQARDAHRQGPWSVVDKPKAGPSGNVHDYYHVAPNFYPDILDDGSLAFSWPYVQKGYGPPELPLFAHPRHKQWDETRFVSMSYNVTILSLASYFTGQDIYAQYAVKVLKHWFWDEDTYMTPHLRFASVRWNHNESEWQGEHVSDFRSVYFLLDAVQLLTEGGHVKARQLKMFKQWMRDFLDWLETDLQGKYAAGRDDYHGLYYDIMCASIAYYLRDEAKAVHYVYMATSRMRNHFNDRYELKVELGKSRCEDGQMQALYAWHVLARMAGHMGVDLWRVHVSDWNLTDTEAFLHYIQHLPDDDGYDPTQLYQKLPVLCAASARAIPFVIDRPLCKTSGDNRRQSHLRWWPLFDGYRRQCPDWPVENYNGTSWMTPRSARRPPTGRYHMPFLYDHLDNIAPFWNLGYRIKSQQ